MSARKQQAHAFGIAAEQLCAQYLTEKGYAILGVRVRTSGGEIDIVARHGDTLVVVEVKARAKHESALYSITPHKQKRLAQAAEALMSEEMIGLIGTGSPNMRFDAMIVAPGESPFHLEDAWRP